MILAAQDGITGHYSGVGTLAQAHIRVLARTAHACEVLFGTALVVSTVTPLRQRPTHAYDPHILAASRRICRSTGGDVVLVEDGDPHGHWIGLPAWRAASSAAAEAALRRQLEAEAAHNQPVDLAVVAVDVPFAGTASQVLLASTPTRGERTAIFTPQSTAADQASGKSEALDEVRHDWELGCAHDALASGAHVGAASPYAFSHLARAWGLEAEALTPHLVGLDPSAGRYNISVPEVARILRNNGLPIDRPLLVSMGRAEPEKSLDTLLRVDRRVLGNAVRVVVAGLYSPRDAPIAESNRDVVRRLRRLAARDSSSVLILGFDASLGAALLAWPGTMVTLVPSRSEPLGILGLEARFLARPRRGHGHGATLMLADTPGLVDHAQGIDGVASMSESNGLAGVDVVDMHAPNGIAALNNAVDSALHRTPMLRRQMRMDAAATLDPYLLSHSLPRLLALLLPRIVIDPRAVTAHLDQVAPEIRQP